MINTTPEMTDKLNKPRIFVSYSHKDAALKLEFDTNLRVMERQGIIDKWTDGEIQPGDFWEESITHALKKSHVIIFFVSNNFIDSTFIRDVEAPIAMQMANEGKAIIVPLLLRNTPGWKREKWYSLQALPSGVKPVEDEFWKSTTAAFTDVEERLREIIELLPNKLADRAKEWEKTMNGKAELLEPLPLAPAPLLTKCNDLKSSKLSPENLEIEKSLAEKANLSFFNKWKLAICSVILMTILTASYIFYTSEINFRGAAAKTQNAPEFLPRLYNKDKPFENSLGMKFVSLPGTDLLCSIWELRLGDFKTFADADNYPVTEKMSSYEFEAKLGVFAWGYYGRTWKNPGFEQSDDHPVVGITLIDAKKFCEWLTKSERSDMSLPAGYEYRIIRDEEWSLSVGDTLYPWNPYVLPPSRRGNYGGLRLAFDDANHPEDSEKFEGTTSVGKFAPNELGIFDLGGNVMEMCDTKYSKELNSPFLLKKFGYVIDHSDSGFAPTRGSGWFLGDTYGALSELRWPIGDATAGSALGFRLVLSPIDYSLPKDLRNANKIIVDIKEYDKIFKLTYNIDNQSYAIDKRIILPLTEKLVNFEIAVQYRVLNTTKNTGFGLGFEFRKGAIAPNGYRAFVNHLKIPSWGSGYFDNKNEWQQGEFLGIDKGLIAIDGTINRILMIVEGENLKIWSNDCLIGGSKFDEAQLAGDITFVSQLNPFEGSVIPENQMVELVIDYIKIIPIEGDK